MGYQTDYRLLADNVDEVQESLEELSGYDGWWDSYKKGELNMSAKWYEHDENMIELSKKYPEKLFTLHGNGEEDFDIWVKYYKNGKTYSDEPEIIYPEFDEDKLG